MRESQSRISGLRVVQITALGTSAKMFLVEHFKKLREAGAEVILVCSDDDDARYTAEVTGIRHCPVQIKQNAAPLADIASLYHLWRVLRRLRPHVVHVHMSKAGFVGTLTAWMVGVPIRIYHTHGLSMETATGLSRLLLRSVEWLTNRLATDVLFCSHSTLEVAVTSGVAVRERCRVLGPGTIAGLNVRKFSPDSSGQRRAAQRKAWGVDDEKLVVGFVGRLSAEKGVDTLIQAWRRLDASVRARGYLILVGGFTHLVGREERTRRIVQQAVAEGIGVLDAGWVDDMVSCYSGMDVLVLPSWREGLPYCILEAQSMGLPVIATRVTGNVDAVEHEVTGLLVPLNNPAALVGALSRLICSGKERRRFGERGRQRIVNEFSQDEVLRNMLAFYSEVASRMKA